MASPVADAVEQTTNRPLRVIAGGELGVLAVCQAPSVAQLDQFRQTDTWGVACKEEGITHLACRSREGLEDTGTAVLCAARASGQLTFQDSSTGTEHSRLDSVPDGAADNAICYSGCLWHALPTEARAFNLLTCCFDGSVLIRQMQADLGGAWTDTAAWQTHKHVCCADMQSERAWLAVGPKDAEPSVWDIDTQQQVFAARAPKGNPMTPQEPPWATAIAAVPGQGGNCFVVGTAHHHIRLFDARAHRRPVCNVNFGESRITALQPEPTGDRCWVGNGMGKLELLKQAQQENKEGDFDSALKTYSFITKQYGDLALANYAQVGRALMLYQQGDTVRSILELDELELTLRGYAEVHAALAAMLYSEKPPAVQRAELQIQQDLQSLLYAFGNLEH
ncbi:hypothetical protein WJX73_006012 [Symbiochloris irregularis]|uniref:Uncharacterized protein n=1 Tax=Symbiochloris irregularis TaxID=706552 RepID=A0AAW1PR77_9CHLO